MRAVPRLELDTRNQTAVSALLMLFVSSHVTTYGETRAYETAVGGAVALGADALDDEIMRRVYRHAAASDS